jgi:electron transport complex protein RnfG
MVRVALLLGVFAAVGTAMVAFVQHSTKARIAANERAEMLRSLHEILPDSAYDNDIINTTIEITHEALGDDEINTAYLAFKQQTPVGVVLTVTAPGGYNGPIKLLVGLYHDGSIAGVRVVAHRETPGLGDKIEIRRHPWISGFDGRSLQDPPGNLWKVKQDGGVFDQFTGATITPRAVVDAVRRSLLYFAENNEELFIKPPRKTANPDE